MDLPPKLVWLWPAWATVSVLVDVLNLKGVGEAEVAEVVAELEAELAPEEPVRWVVAFLGEVSERSPDVVDDAVREDVPLPVSACSSPSDSESDESPENGTERSWLALCKEIDRSVEETVSSIVKRVKNSYPLDGSVDGDADFVAVSGREHRAVAVRSAVPSVSVPSDNGLTAHALAGELVDPVLPRGIAVERSRRRRPFQDNITRRSAT